MFLEHSRDTAHVRGFLHEHHGDSAQLAVNVVPIALLHGLARTGHRLHPVPRTKPGGYGRCRYHGRFANPLIVVSLALALDELCVERANYRGGGAPVTSASIGPVPRSPQAEYALS